MDQAHEIGLQNGSLFKKACDPCRSRKVKCNKELPCSACEASNLPCVTTERREGLKRKRIHVSEDYERKIDQIEAKLAGLDQVLLQARPLHQISTSHGRESSHPSPNTSSGDGTKQRTLFSDSDQPDVDGEAYEGDTSLNAYSNQARALVERVLGQGSFAATTPEVNSAISSLRALSNGSRAKPASPITPKANAFNSVGFDPRRLPLPPTNAVLEILRRSKETQTVTFDLPFNWMTLPRLTEFCRSVFFSVDDYPASTAIIVFAHLYLLFQEFSWRASDPLEKTDHRQCAELCRSNFETCVSNLDILLPATPENIEALLLGAAHAVETSRLNVSWKLKSIALTLVQALGWHRAKTLEKEDKGTQNTKQKIFWWLYMLDKGLSLRLGRASLFQDYDIDLPTPNLGVSEFDKHCDEISRLAVQVCRVQGMIYEQLYSPGALGQSAEVRRQRAQLLIDELNSVRAKADTIAEQTIDPSRPTFYDVQGAYSIFIISDSVTHYTNLTMIYRAIPSQTLPGEGPPTLSRECLQNARLALTNHQDALKFKEHDFGMWSQYLAWTILYAPFTPFLVVFSNVLVSADTRDLALLGDFVSSISDSDFCEGARKMHHVCDMFLRIAKLYVKAKQQASYPSQETPPRPSGEVFDNQSDMTTGAAPSQNSTPGCDLNALNPYLNAIGFAGDPMLDLNSGINADVGDWFNGNQWVMGLLDDDMYSSVNMPPQALN